MELWHSRYKENEGLRTKPQPKKIAKTYSTYSEVLQKLCGWAFIQLQLLLLYVLNSFERLKS